MGPPTRANGAEAVHAATLVVTDPDLQMLPRCLWRDGPLSDADIRTCRGARGQPSASVPRAVTQSPCW